MPFPEGFNEVTALLRNALDLMESTVKAESSRWESLERGDSQSKRVQKLQEDVQKLEEEVEDYKEAHSTAEARAQKVEGRLEKHRTAIAERDQELDRLSKKLTRSEKQVGTLEAQLRRGGAAIGNGQAPPAVSSQQDTVAADPASAKKRKVATAVKAGSPAKPLVNEATLDCRTQVTDQHVEEPSPFFEEPPDGALADLAEVREESLDEPQEEALDAASEEPMEERVDAQDSRSRSRRQASRSRSRGEAAEDAGASAVHPENAQQPSVASKKGGGGQLCFTFLIGKCNRENCPDRHPEEQKLMRDKMQRTPCALGATCRRKDCFYKHPNRDQ